MWHKGVLSPMVSVTDRQDVQGAIIDYTSVVLHRPIPTQFRPGLAFSPKKMDLLWIFSFGKNIFPRPNFPTHENPLQCRTSVYFSLELSVTDKRQSNKGGCRKSENIKLVVQKKNEPNHSFYSCRTILNCEKRIIIHFISNFQRKV